MTNKTNNEHEEIEGGIPSIGEDRGAINVSPTKAKKGKVLILVGFCIFSIVLLASVIMIVVKQASKSHEQQAASQLKMPTEDLQQATYEPKKTVTTSMQEIIEQQKKAELDKQEQERKERLAQADADRRSAEQEALARKRAEQEAANRPPPEQQAQSTTDDKNKPLTPEQRRLQGVTLVDLSANNQVGGLAGQGGGTPNGTAPNMDASALMGSQSGGASSPINDSLKGESYENGFARNIGDRDYLMIHGTSLPCVVITKIVTDYKGIVKCQLTKDIYSVTGTTMLLERGTVFMGEQKVAITQGVGRVFLNWTEADTPLGIRVRLDSLGTDSLGAAGSEAWIDNHYSERFGGALLISFAQDAFDAAAKSATKNSSDVTFDNSTNTANDMASEVLKNTIGIPPTAYINQGDLVNILVARDIDFKSVYINK